MMWQQLNRPLPYFISQISDLLTQASSQSLFSPSTTDVCMLLLTIVYIYLRCATRIPGLNADIAWSWLDLFQVSVIIDQSKFTNVPGPYLIALAPHGNMFIIQVNRFYDEICSL